MGGGSRRTRASSSSNSNNNSRKRKSSSNSSGGGGKKSKKTSSRSSSNTNTTTATSTATSTSSIMWSSSSHKSSKSSSSAAVNKKNNQLENNAEAMFQELAAQEDDPEMLSMEGIAVLGEKLNLDVESDIRILVLLWKLQASKPGALLKSEWMDAATRSGILNVSNKWESLREQLPAFDVGFLTGNEFKDFYKFCFQFNRQGTHRTLDRDLVVALLKLVLKDRVLPDRLESFCEFLETLNDDPAKQQQYNRITLDQWTSFWDFCVECEDLQSYDESTSAWPVLIDEYVEFMEEKLKEK